MNNNKTGTWLAVVLLATLSSWASAAKKPAAPIAPATCDRPCLLNAPYNSPTGRE